MSIFVWDGRGSMSILANNEHVHSVTGECLKNRHGQPCKKGAK